jgi:hypothetical protein
VNSSLDIGFGPMTLQAAGWLFAAAVAAHNLEEAVWLPRWSRRGGPWRRPVDPFAFRFAVGVLAALATALALVVPAAAGVWAHLQAGYALAMALNLLFPHLLASALTWSYAPGTGTAMLLSAPASLLLIKQSFAEGHIDWATFRIAGPLVVFGFIAAVPLLFWIGGRLKPPLQGPAA